MTLSAEQMDSTLEAMYYGIAAHKNLYDGGAMEARKAAAARLMDVCVSIEANGDTVTLTSSDKWKNKEAGDAFNAVLRVYSTHLAGSRVPLDGTIQNEDKVQLKITEQSHVRKDSPSAIATQLAGDFTFLKSKLSRQTARDGQIDSASLYGTIIESRGMGIV